ncbi:E3 ubiquitin ligase family protein [Streptomyces pinistramenti]|uniref:E3 ubiquitin ligase family protein n=1 Tax=Streptomyces pinistramenti TaxID=2884812 RepID=UPI001D0649FC|nr:E3 ubiquitin ligase family protein [Streptomyces pinistramenti]MCB5908411.1 E3 ubiquitin ligase family protein [Streptomyces pinistramenti]
MFWIPGLIALAAAALCGFLHRVSRTRARVMERTETLPVHDLRALHAAAAEAAGAGHFRYRCEVAGLARPHKDGALRSQIAELDCVWHRHKVTRKYEETYRDSDGNRRRRTRNDVVSQHTTSTAFFVEDATGKMVIRPGEHPVVGAEKVVDRFDPHTSGGNRLEIGPLSLNLGGDGTIGFRHEEWIVRPGSRFFVHGEAADGSGRLAVGAPAEGGVFVMSVKPEEELLRGERRKALLLGAGTGVLGLAGVVLLVLAVIR